jgi:hypothetical protein
MRSLFVSTEGGRAGTIDGLNLFFGALLGANLGTLDHLPIWEYIRLIVLLAGTVIVLRMYSTSKRRIMMLVVLGAYAMFLTGMIVLPDLQPRGMSAEDVQRLAATLGVWVLFVIGADLSPMERKQEARGDAKVD